MRELSAGDYKRTEFNTMQVISIVGSLSEQQTLNLTLHRF